MATVSQPRFDTLAVPLHAVPAVRTRRADVDLARLVAAIFVLQVHSAAAFVAAGAQSSGGTYWLATVVDALGRPASAIFFALAGWAILSHPAPADWSSWLSRRLIRLGLPVLSWSVLYVALQLAIAALHGPWPPGGDLAGWVGDRARIMLLGPGVTYHLWFMYLLLPMTVILWLVRARPAFYDGSPSARRDWIFYGLVAGSLVGLYGVVAGLGLTLSWPEVAWAVAYGALGYAVLEGPRPLWAVGLGVYAVAVGCLTVLSVNRLPLLTEGLPMIMATVGILWVIRCIEIPLRLRLPLAAVASLVFGEYLVHVMVLRFAQSLANKIPFTADLELPRLVLTFALVTAVSFAAAWTWHRSRHLRTILG